MEEVELHLQGLQVKKVTFDSGKAEYGTGGRWNTTMKIKEGNINEEESTFIIQFNLSLINNDKDFSVNIIADGIFKTNAKIDSEFKKSLYIRANAPAIVFPYLRTFVSTLILNAGYHPVILPSYNFINMAKQREKEEEEELERLKSEDL